MVDFSKEISFGSLGRKKDGDASVPADAPGKRSARGKAVYPTKTTINLVEQEANRSSVLVQIALFAVVVVLIALFSKFAVVDPLVSGLDSSAEVASAQARLDELTAANENYAALNEQYARYVVTGLTEEELNLADRTELLDLVQANFLSVGYLSSLKVKDNTVTATCLGVDLAEVSQLVERLESDSRVAHVTVSTAQGKDQAGTSATIDVTLKGAAEAASSGTEAAAGVAGAAGSMGSAVAGSASAAGEGAGNGTA